MSESRPETAFESRIATRAFIIAVAIWAVVMLLAAIAGEFLGVGVFSLGILAILWLLVLMLWGVFSPSFKPYPDEPRLPPGSEL